MRCAGLFCVPSTPLAFRSGVVAVLQLGCTCARADDVDELIAAARANALASRSGWHALLHYQPAVLGVGVKSLADDPAFFLDPKGKTDPQAELEATLAAFFSDMPETDRQQNPQCRFIARYRWLKAELGFDAARLPEQPCTRFHDWRRNLDPAGVTLIFPAAYLNSPASMYGHTLLRIDGKDQTERTRLLAYAINYAAATGPDEGPLYALKGLLGWYPGRFTMSPYYIKVNEYNDLESRDIWEYQLTLTPAETDRLLMHVWELGPIHFDYYFLDENCSYHLLSLLEMARPGLRLSEKFKYWAIPTDTVRAVVDTPGLVANVVYRPARGTSLAYWATLEPPAAIGRARALATGRITPDAADLQTLTEAERATTLDLAFEYLEFQRLSGKLQGPETASRLRSLLLARSRVEGPAPPAAPEPAVRPDQGHRSARIALGAGTTAAGGFSELRLRPAYHDLLDPEPGYTRGAQLEFVSVALRRENDVGTLRLERLSIVDVTSLTPQNALLKPLSWRINFGLDRTRLEDNTQPLVGRVTGGAGVTFAPGRGLLVYALPELGLRISRSIDAGYAFGAGVGAGAIVDLTNRWRLHAYAQGLRHLLGDERDAYQAGLEQRIALGRDLALRIEAVRRDEFGARWTTVGAYLNYYF